MRTEPDRVRPPGHEDLLRPLGQRDDRHARQVEGFCIAASAADSCPLPPSITTRFGVAAKDSS